MAYLRGDFGFGLVIGWAIGAVFNALVTRRVRAGSTEKHREGE